MKKQTLTIPTTLNVLASKLNVIDEQRINNYWKIIWVLTADFKIVELLTWYEITIVEIDHSKKQLKADMPYIDSFIKQIKKNSLTNYNLTEN